MGKKARCPFRPKASAISKAAYSLTRGWIAGGQGEADEEAGEDGGATGADMMQKALDHLQLARRHLAAAEKQARSQICRFQKIVNNVMS